MQITKNCDARHSNTTPSVTLPSSHSYIPLPLKPQSDPSKILTLIRSSTVNYQRPGASSLNSLSWNSPIHIVTYYRFIRFLRDGTCISLLTTSEPADVVPYLHMEHVHKNHGNLPSAPMKDALLGRWRLSGPTIPSLHPSTEDGEGSAGPEKEGTLYVETAGVTPKYLYKMILSVGNAGRAAKNNKLSWQSYWSYNKLTDDWGEFGLKNDRPFYWSRVKSWGLGFVEEKEKDAEVMMAKVVK